MTKLDRRGFASMDPEKRRKIASKGGIGSKRAYNERKRKALEAETENNARANL